MGFEVSDSIYAKITEQLDALCKRIDEKIEREYQQLEACKKKSELESRLAEERKLNEQLTERLALTARRLAEMQRECAGFELHLAIADSDQARLNNARDMYQIAKELTGIRLDFTAPPNIAKGYIKNESRKLLEPFEMDMSGAGCSDAVWALIGATTQPHHADKENVAPKNK